MKNQTKLFATLLMLVLSTFFIGCSDDDPQPALEYKTDGYIKGKIVGVSEDNSYTFNDDFNFTQYSILLGAAQSTYEINDDGSFDIEIARYEFSSGGSAYLSFELSNAADVTPDDMDIEIRYYKELNDKIVYFNMEEDIDNTFSITDFTFDVTTGKVKGKYTLSGSSNSTNKNATVSGDFEVTAKKIVN